MLYCLDNHQIAGVIILGLQRKLLGHVHIDTAAISELLNHILIRMLTNSNCSAVPFICVVFTIGMVLGAKLIFTDNCDVNHRKGDGTNHRGIHMTAHQLTTKAPGDCKLDGMTSLNLLMASITHFKCITKQK